MHADLGNRSYWYRIFRLRSEALWVFIGQLGMALGLLFGIKILTHFLDPLEFGRLALANTVVLLVGTNLFGPFGQGFMRFWRACVPPAHSNPFGETMFRIVIER